LSRPPLNSDTLRVDERGDDEPQAEVPNMGAALKSMEKRATKRLPIRVLVEYESAEDFLIDYTANMSVGGMFIQTDDPLPMGTRFRLRFRVPGHDKIIETFGEVRWCVPPAEAGPMHPGMGIQFDDLKASDLELVTGLLQRWEVDELED